jgi:hypothetical protein
MNFDNVRLRNALPGAYKHHLGKQASVLLSNDDYNNLIYSCHNRTVDERHASTLETFIRDKAFKGEIVDTLKLAMTMDDMCSRHFQDRGVAPVYVVDGQHRILAVKTLMNRYPGVTFCFLADIYIYNNVSEIGDAVKALQNSLPLSMTQKVGISGRGRFVEALNNILRRCGENPNRICIRNIPMNYRLKDGSPAVAVLRMKTIKEIEKMIMSLGADYERRYRRACADGDIKNATREVITNTKMYQLVDTSLAWLDRIASFDDVPTATYSQRGGDRRVVIEEPPRRKRMIEEPPKRREAAQDDCLSTRSHKRSRK